MRIHTSLEELRVDRRLRLLRWVGRLTRRLHKRRVSRFCDRWFYTGTPRTSLQLIAPFHRGLLLHVDTNSWLERWILNRGYYEPEVVSFLDAALRPGMVAMDV